MQEHNQGQTAEPRDSEIVQIDVVRETEQEQRARLVVKVGHQLEF